MAETRSNSEDSDKTELRIEVPSKLGDYQILGEIGRGGMGVVYEAEQLSLGRRVALKMLPRDIAGDDSTVKRFEREARAAAQMHHTNIVPVFEVGRSGELLYYTMQLIRGCGLDDLVEAIRQEKGRYQLENIESSPAESESPESPHSFSPPSVTSRVVASLLSGGFQFGRNADSSGATSVKSGTDSGNLHAKTSDSVSTVDFDLHDDASRSTIERQTNGYWRTVARIGLDAAMALAYSHAHGIVHRDIKPSNLILDESGVIWVTDFGLAMTEDSNVTRTGDVLGTLRYLAPERFEGRCDERSDIYALGLTLYELMALRPAYASANRWHLIRQICEGQPVAPGKFDSSIPRDLETIVLKASDKKPESRYATAEEFADDLQRFLADQPIRARTPSLFERYLRWRQKNAGLSNALAFIVLLVVLTLAVAIGGSIRESGLRQDAEVAKEDAERSARLAEQRRLEQQRTLYFAEMNLAGQAANANRGALVVSQKTQKWLSSPERAALRGWEWFYLSAKLKSAGTEVPTFLPGFVSWSSDDSKIAVAKGLRDICVLDAESHETIWEIELDEKHDQARVAWHPELPLLVIAQFSGAIQIWDIDKDEKVHELRDEQNLAGAISWSPDGEWLAWGSQGSAKVWQYNGQSKPERLKGSPGITNVIQWNRDGTRLFGGNWWSNEGALWDVEKKELIRTLPGRNVRWDPDSGQISHYLSTDTRGEITVWDANTDLVLHRLFGHRSLAKCLEWNDDSSLLLSGSLDNTIRLWEFPSAELVRGFAGHNGDIASIAWARNQEQFVSTGTTALRIWDIESKVERARRNKLGLTRMLKWHPAGEIFATAHSDNKVRIWRSRDFAMLAVLKGHTQQAHSLAWNSDASMLATCGRDGRILLFDMSEFTDADEWEDEEPIEMSATSRWTATASLLDITWSPDGNRILATGTDHSVAIWQADDPAEPVFSMRQSLDTHCARWTSDGNQLLLGWGNYLSILDGNTYETIETVELETRVISLDLNPDETAVVVSGRDPLIEIWDLESRSRTKFLTGHQGAVWCVDWSADGERIFSSSEDGSVKVWDPVSGYEALSLSDVRSSGQIWNVQLNPKGTQLAASCAGSAVLLWDATAAIEAESVTSLKSPLPTSDEPLSSSTSEEPTPAK